MVYNE